MGIKTLFIAPYRGLKELAVALGRQQEKLDLIIEEADLNAAIPVVKAHENNGIQFIISRGGTAKLIHEYTEIPVIEIKLSGYDILRTLTLVKDFQMKVHMIGFPNICNDVLSVANLLHIDISYTMVDHKGEVEEAVKTASANGAQLILGDTITVNTAESFGLHGMLISSGKESVLEAFDQVEQMNQFMIKIENHFSMYENLLNQWNEGIVVFKEDGQITFLNRNFQEKFLKKDRSEDSVFLLPEQFLPLIPEVMDLEMSGEAPYSNITLEGEVFQVRGGRLDHHKEVYYYFAVSSKIVEREKGITIFRNRGTRKSFAHVVAMSPAMEMVLSKAQELAEKRESFIIWGKKGVGKRFLASVIHWSGNPQSPFIELVIQKNTPKVTEEITSFVDTLEEGTLYVTGLESLPMEQQRLIIERLQMNGDIRVIYSFTFDPREDESLSGMEVLADEGNEIHVPTLRERSEDLEGLIRLFVGIYNNQYGKQVVGIKEEALAILRGFDWGENVRELQDTVKKIVKNSDGDFIEKQLVEGLDNKQHHQGVDSPPLDLTKTLEEIEKDIIMHVLQEEGMNQSRAAKRLGINRATLWRKLK